MDDISLLGLSDSKTFGKSKTLTESGPGAANTLSISSLTSSGSITITAGKSVTEASSAKTDLNLANAKHIGVFEKKLQTAFNECIKFKVKEDEIWNGLESKFSSAKTMSEQLTDTLQHLAFQTDDAMIRNNESAITSNGVAIESLKSKLGSLVKETEKVLSISKWDLLTRN